jgi:ATP-binding cassette, subfamily B, multidrug efflux pump
MSTPRTQRGTLTRRRGDQESPRGPHGGPIGPGTVDKAKNPRATLNRLLSYLLVYKAELLIIGIFVAISSLLNLFGPYYVGVAVDDFIAIGDLAGLLGIVLLLLAIYLGAWGTQAIQGVLMARVSQRVLKGLRRDLFEHLQTLSLSYFNRNTQGELMSRLTNDVEAINQALSQSFIQLISSFLSLIGILIAMFLLNVWLALGSLVVLPLMVLVTVLIGRKTLSGFRGVQRSMGILNSRIEETVSGQRVVTAFGTQARVLAAFDAENSDLRDRATTATSWAFMIMPLVTVMSTFSIAVVAGLGGWLALQGAVTIGIITSFIFYSRNFVQPLRQLAELYNSVQSALAGAERIFEVVDTKPEITDKPDAKPIGEIQGDVKFENVSFSYIPGVPVLKNMSFHAQPGQIIALVGPTGAGKTTMINVLGRFYDIQEGSIKVDGIDIRETTRWSLRKQLGTVLQDNFLFADTVMENIRYGNPAATDEDCITAAKLANADQWITRLPKGYDTMLNERGSNLSQGQRQLLAIARAVVTNPKILILDEATSNVDTRTEARIQEALFRLMEKRTSFVIAHRLSTIRKADQVIVIKDGEIIERGTHDSLLKAKGFYYNLYNSQFRGTNSA